MRQCGKYYYKHVHEIFSSSLSYYEFLLLNVKRVRQVHERVFLLFLLDFISFMHMQCISPTIIIELIIMKYYHQIMLMFGVIIRRFVVGSVLLIFFDAF